VAVKIIPKEKVAGEDLKLLRREVLNLSSLRHPNILRLNEVYEDPKNFYLVMEIIRVRCLPHRACCCRFGLSIASALEQQGQEVFDKVVSLGAYSERDASHIFAQILAGVQYLHERGIAHRDLKVRCDRSDRCECR
jgi:serine/threonine protein kinase